MRLIYLADDDEDDRSIFSTALKSISATLTIKIAEDGSQLLELLNRDTPPYPDLIFLDVNMPKMNGLEALKELKQHPHLKKVPVVIISTSSNEEKIKELRQNGAHFYIIKPNSINELEKLLLQMMKKIVIKFIPTTEEDFILK